MSGSSPGSALKSSASSRPPLVSVRSIEAKICKLQTAVLNNPADLDSRKLLVHCLIILADYSERHGDNSTASRYYEAAARALRQSTDQAMHKQACSVSASAERNHALRMKHLKNLKRLGFVSLKFNLKQCKYQDRAAVVTYLSSINDKLLDAWSDAEHRCGLLTSAELAHAIEVVFKVQANGLVSDMKLVSTSDRAELDRAALETIESLGKLPPLPACLAKVVQLRAIFSK